MQNHFSMNVFPTNPDHIRKKHSLFLCHQHAGWASTNQPMRVADADLVQLIPGHTGKDHRAATVYRISAACRLTLMISAAPVRHLCPFTVAVNILSTFIFIFSIRDFSRLFGSVTVSFGCHGYDVYYICILYPNILFVYCKHD